MAFKQFSLNAETRRMVEDQHKPFGEGPNPGVDWHAARQADEPECGKWQWRTSNRMVVLDVKNMDDTFFAHVVRFATGKFQHVSRMNMLFDEREIRMSIHNQPIPKTEGTQKYGR